MMMMNIITITITAIIVIKFLIAILSNCDQAKRGNRYKIKNKKGNINKHLISTPTNAHT